MQKDNKILKIQLLSFQYINDILELYQQLLPEENIFLNENLLTVFKSIMNKKEYNIIIGIINGKVITTCTLLVIPNITHNMRPYGIIENVITHAEYRGEGYGAQVINYAKNIALENNCHKIMVQTRRKDERVFRFYKKVGFEDNISKGFWMDL